MSAAMGYIPRRLPGPSRAPLGCTQELMALQMASFCAFRLARCRRWWRWWLQEASGTTRSLHDVSENKQLSLEIYRIWQVYPASVPAQHDCGELALWNIVKSWLNVTLSWKTIPPPAKEPSIIIGDASARPLSKSEVAQ